MALPQTRTLTDTGGWRWTVTVDRGRLVLTREGGQVIEFDDPAELRSLAPQLTRAVAEHALDTQLAAVKASHARLPAGSVRHRPYVEPAEPALNLDPLIPRQESA